MKVHAVCVLFLCLLHQVLSKPHRGGRARGEVRHARLLLVPSYPENVTVVQGGQAALECRIHRPATTGVQWLKRDGETDDGLRPLTALQVNASLSVHTLQLVNVTRADGGEYVCVAEGSHGGRPVQATQSAWLQVLPGADVQRSVDQNDAGVPTGN
ncbi:hypothetical protein NHX12_009540 [Muraenolepis orangiensis]|uniref:receptor protein-tyrosine kinase n=1 Tax=Muraenolepis orangiensis TaxID=630683 RepID=A0A9Q0I9L3_9TELE|nr:hypothetical protein NHX12_009540 [Muraenolepis orangiensis]